MKQTFRKILVAALVLCTFVGILPMIAAENSTAQAAAATVYYDFKKANNGYPNAAADKRTAFAALTYDEVAARNTTITSGAWAYHSFTATPDSSAGSNEQTSFTSGSFFYYHYDKTKGFTMLTGSRQGVLTAGIKFKGMNAGKYVPYLNINGSYLRTYSGTLTAKIYPLNSTTPIVTKEICLSDYPEDDSYIQLSNAVSFSASEYVLELTINNERTITIINGLQLVAADSIIVTGLYPTNDLGVYEVKVGETKNIPFTQVFSDGTVTTNKLSGWGYTTDNSYVTTGVNSSSRYFTLKGVTETSTPQTVYFSVGNAKVKLNVIVRASNYSATQSDVVYNFKKARPINWSANHVHNFGKHIKYSHTAVGGYAEVNTAITSAPWKVKSIPSTSDFSVLYDGYGIEHRGNGTTDLMIQVPVAGTYMPQLQLYPTIGAQTEVTVSILTTGGSTVCSKTIAAGTTTEYINLATNGVNLSATEYIVRFNKPSTGSSKQAGANYYNGIKLVKTNNTTVTLDPNGGVAGTKTSVTATNGLPMPGVDAEGYLPTRTGYRFGGYYDTKDTSGTQYYTKDGRSNHVWDKTGSTATLYACWNINTYSVKYNANGGSGTMSNSSHTYGTAKALTANAFTRTGYTFLGWSTSSTATTATYTDKASVKNLSTTNGATVNLYAVWQANTYTVTLDGQSATTAGTATVTATYGSAMPSITVPAKTGYTFGGYYTEKNGSGTQYYTSSGASAKNWDKTAATTLYAKWTAKTSTVTLSAADATTAGTASVTATYGSAMPSITVPQRTGYAFAGYYTATSGGTKYYNADGSSARNWNKTGAQTLYAQWTAKTYTVTLNANGGTAGTTSVTASYNLAMPEIETLPTKTGYTFKGYYDAASGGTQYYKADGTSARTWNKTAATTLYAQWTANTYTVKFNANTGSGTMSDQVFTYDVAQNLTANTFTRTGYTFAGWSLNSVKYTDGQSVKNLATSGSVTLYATWTPNTYTVEYNANGGSGTMSNSSHTYGTASNLTANAFTRTGYTFAGWATSATGSKAYNDKASVTTLAASGTKTLYAVWTANTYAVTFDDQGATTAGTASTTATYGAAMPSVTPPKKTGYTFGGYYIDAACTGTQYYKADGTSARNWTRTVDTTLYAKWTANTYTVKFNANTGSGTMSDQVFTYDVAQKLTANTFTRTGYTFAGWSLNSVKYTDGQSIKNLAASGSVTLYATWTPNTYTVTLSEGGTITATYNSAMPAITVPTKTGYTFGGYYIDAACTGTQYYKADGTSARNWTRTVDTTLYAKWTPNTYTVTLNEGGTVTATYDAAMPSITVPEKTGYIFGGYFTGENGSGTQYYKADGSSAKNWDKTGDVTLYANWIQGDVTITPIGDKTVAIEENLTFTVKATSTAPGDITYTAENLPAGATFDSSTGKFSWTPTAAQVGEYTIIFKGSDGVNFAEVTIKVTVDEIKTAVSFNEGQDNDIIATYGEALPAITAPEKEGFIFDGYYDGADGTGTKYYNADGTPAKVWDKKDATVTLYAKWIQGDERLGTRSAVLRDITYKDENGKTKFGLYLLAGIDSLLYKEVGFEVTIDGYTVKQGTNVVYQKISDNKNSYLPTAFGKLCQYGFALRFDFEKEFKDKTVTFRAYAKDFDDNTIYGKEVTFEGIYTNLVEDDENGGDIEIDGEVEYA